MMVAALAAVERRARVEVRMAGEKGQGEQYIKRSIGSTLRSARIVLAGARV